MQFTILLLDVCSHIIVKSLTQLMCSAQDDRMWLDKIIPELEHNFSKSNDDIGDCGFSENSDNDPNCVQDMY